MKLSHHKNAHTSLEMNICTNFQKKKCIMYEIPWVHLVIGKIIKF